MGPFKKYATCTCYSLKLTNYGMGDKNIFRMYGCFTISYYIKGVENRILYIITFLDPHVYVNNPY